MRQITLITRRGRFAFNKQKILHSQNRDKKLKEWLREKARDLFVTYNIFPIYLDREILFLSWKSQGILSTYACGNHDSK